jgi:hypothetical protein
LAPPSSSTACQISKTHLGYATSRNKGTCHNRLGMSRQALEQTILDDLKKHLMDPLLFKEFSAEFIKEVNRLKQDHSAQRALLEGGLARVGRRTHKMVDAIVEGGAGAIPQGLADGLEAREDEIKAKLETTPEPKVYLAPNMRSAPPDVKLTVRAAEPRAPPFTKAFTTSPTRRSVRCQVSATSTSATRTGSERRSGDTRCPTRTS